MSPLQMASRADWEAVSLSLDERGYALLPRLISPETCASVAALYCSSEAKFRSTITMARHSFGRGEYKYFAYPLPPTVEALRRELYEPLAGIVNLWSRRLNMDVIWPDTLSGLLAQCHEVGQTRPTPLLLQYGPGDYNCLHQDLYGEIHFPLQVIILLSTSGCDFEGGELVLVEQRPRQQSIPRVIMLQQGDAVIVPVSERPVRGAKGWRRHQVRHGVSEIRSGQRHTLGIMFHDAA